MGGPVQNRLGRFAGGSVAERGQAGDEVGGLDLLPRFGEQDRQVEDADTVLDDDAAWSPLDPPSTTVTGACRGRCRWCALPVRCGKAHRGGFTGRGG